MLPPGTDARSTSRHIHADDFWPSSMDKGILFTCHVDLSQRQPENSIFSTHAGSVLSYVV